MRSALLSSAVSQERQIAHHSECIIHTDFEKGFIKAEVIGFDDLVETGSIAEARARGKARVEGKDYVMSDGDVVEFRFNN